MDNCKLKNEEKCWEKVSMHFYLINCTACKCFKPIVVKFAPIECRDIRIDRHGRIFIGDDEI